ncbi:MAG: hypothetical protein KKI08_08680, partial [Armatimonadetes bacterium]|nr:hypothetical protein [Armatimonadota bacterium]
NQTTRMYERLRASALCLTGREMVLRQITSYLGWWLTFDDAAQAFFIFALQDMRNEIVLSLSRLLDPEKTGGRHENLSMDRVANEFGAMGETELVVVLHEIRSKLMDLTEEVRLHRKKKACLSGC